MKVGLFFPQITQMGRDWGRAGLLRRFCRNNFEELVLKVGLLFPQITQMGRDLGRAGSLRRFCRDI